MMTEPELIIVMGVSGCGKSTVASAIADRLGYTFIEADDFHSPDNRATMAAGQALSNEMREPWIVAICDFLKWQFERNTSCVLAYSGLNASHRARIRATAKRAMTIHLSGDRTLIHSRIQNRAGHFMPASLLDSQFDSLQDPSREPNTVSIDIDCSSEQLIEQTMAAIDALRQ